MQLAGGNRAAVANTNLVKIAVASSLYWARDLMSNVLLYFVQGSWQGERAR